MRTTWSLAAAIALVLVPALTVTASRVSADIEHDRDVVRRWVDVTRELVQRHRLSAPVAARVYAYTTVAMADASPEVELWKRVNGHPDIGALQRRVAEQGRADVAVAAAAATTLSGLFGTEHAEEVVALALTSERTRAGASASELAVQEGAGREIGEVVLQWAERDGYHEAGHAQHQVSGSAGGWVQTPPSFARALEPGWGELRMFLVPSVASCPAPPPVPYDPSTGSAFHHAALDVYEASRQLTEEQRQVAVWWDDSAGRTSTPAGHWLAITGRLAEGANLDRARTVELHAIVAVTMSDAFVAAWHEKYRYDLVRPVTYLRERVDATWSPQLVTPPFPEYPSGHSVVSAAAAGVLTQRFGDVRVVDVVDGESRTFDSITTAAQESGRSRLYGGIHYPFAIEGGAEQGRCLAEVAGGALGGAATR